MNFESQFHTALYEIYFYAFRLHLFIFLNTVSNDWKERNATQSRETDRKNQPNRFFEHQFATAFKI